MPWGPNSRAMPWASARRPNLAASLPGQEAGEASHLPQLVEDSLGGFLDGKIYITIGIGDDDFNRANVLFYGGKSVLDLRFFPVWWVQVPDCDLAVKFGLCSYFRFEVS